MNTTRQLLSDKEAAVLLGCARSSIWRWAAEGTIPKPLRIRGLSRWRQSDIDGVISRAEEERAA